MKWNIVSAWLLPASVVTSPADAGLRARTTPSIALARALAF